MSDVKFDGETVQVEGNWLKVTCFDLKLDNAGRRKNNTGERRALVHDFNDGLTINWASDYPGGITLKGKVKLDELEGGHLRVHHHDLHLDHPSRRKNNTGDRRALVHNFDDGLTINWANDYPGGVTIRGTVNMPEKLSVKELEGANLLVRHHDLKLDNPDRRKNNTGHRRALVHNFDDGLTINWAKDYPGGVTIRGIVSLPEQLLVKNVDIGAAIKELQNQVAALNTQVQQLEQQVQALQNP